MVNGWGIKHEMFLCDVDSLKVTAEIRIQMSIICLNTKISISFIVYSSASFSHYYVFGQIIWKTWNERHLYIGMCKTMKVWVV